MHFVVRAALVAAALVSAPHALQAQVKLNGIFVADFACPMLQSVRKRTNPGSVAARPGRVYPMHGINREGGTHYQVSVAGAEPVRRWVAVECGRHFVAAADTPATGEAGSPGSDGKGAGGLRTELVLAASWQPAFCETRPEKPECVSMTQDRFDASHLALHGLWPQPRSRAYCGVDEATVSLDKARKWSALPEPELDVETRTALDRVMPGTQSGLDRHEWWKHGTCYGGRSAEEYFADSLVVMKALNGSAVRALFAGNIGKMVTADQIRASFDVAFGPGAGERVRVSCATDQGRRIIGEITIGLSGDITPEADIGALMRAARPISAGCPGGVVDAAGLQ